MRSSNPSALATWLLHCFGQPSESFEGDLLERYRQRRSALWYWRQVLVAIVVETARAIRQEKVGTLKSLIVAVGLFMLLDRLTYLTLTDQVAVWVGNWLLENELHGIRSWWFRLSLYSLLPTLLYCSGLFLIGWMIVRVHPRHTAALALITCAVVFFWSISEIYVIAARLGRDVPTGRIGLDSPWTVFAVWRLSFLCVFQPLSIVGGGGAAARR